MGAVESYFSDCDIILLTETWTAPGAAPPPLSSFVCYATSRPFQHNQAVRSSGGIACYVNQRVAAFASVWKSSCDGCLLWVKLSKAVGMNKDLYICVAYLSPEKSSIWNHQDCIDPFSTLLQDIAEAQALGGGVLLAGDFNAHTSNLPDFIMPEEQADSLPCPPELEPLPANIPARCSSHKGAVNVFGRNLLALCQDSNLLILNGRAVGDREGNLTCRNNNGASLVDYFIASPSIFALNPILQVQTKLPESDHHPLLLQLPLLPQEPQPERVHVARQPVKFKYRSNGVEFFAHALRMHLTFTLTCQLLKGLNALPPHYKNALSLLHPNLMVMLNAVLPNHTNGHLNLGLMKSASSCHNSYAPFLAMTLTTMLCINNIGLQHVESVVNTNCLSK